MPQPTGRRPARQAPARRSPRHGPRLRKRRLMRVAGALSLAVLTAGGLGNVAMGGLGGDIGRVDAFTGLDNRPPRGAGLNFLLVGIDGRNGIAPRQRRLYHLGGDGCHCTDTIMLAHLSADRSRLSVVGIPRDSYVRVRGAGGGPGRREKINAAYSAGGPSLTVRTVERATGVRVDHYLELDFAGFVRTVDALGGVPVCAERPLRDPESGLDLPAGTTLLDGGRALEYVRAREVDGLADLGRMRRQQRFAAELVRRATGTGVLLNPRTFGATTRSALGSVRADPGMRPADLVRLAEAMRGTPWSAEFTSVPLADSDRWVRGIGTVVVWDRARAARLFAAIRADRPLDAGSRAAADRERTADGPAPDGGRETCR